jgi:predicted amidohydrolase
MSNIPQESLAYPSDPADLFLRLYDELDPASVDNVVEVVNWLADESVSDIADIIEEASLVAGFISAERIDELLELADDRELRLFAILLGLDRALMYVNPYFGGFDQGGLTELAIRYAELGRLNSDAAEGALLPRCAFPGRVESELVPTSVVDAFTSVVRVPPEDWQAVAHGRIPAISDFGRLQRQKGLMIGCAPLLESKDDCDFAVSTRHGRRRYRITPRDNEEIRTRMRNILSFLDSSGVMIGVLPELALSESLLSFWRELVASTPAPSDSSLRWLMVGTGNVPNSEPPLNRGVLIDRRSGEILMAQDKLYPFTLSGEQLDEWKLTPLLGRDVITEDITRGDQVAVTETRLGRIAILVCEDLARLFDLGPRLRAHGISHVLAPVFSKQVKYHHWEHVKAKEYATEVGATVIVANSLVVPRLMGEDGAVGTTLVHSPSETDRGECAIGDDVALFELEGGELPGYADEADEFIQPY